VAQERGVFGGEDKEVGAFVGFIEFIEFIGLKNEGFAGLSMRSGKPLLVSTQ
jgi:hypothetical protein